MMPVRIPGGMKKFYIRTSIFTAALLAALAFIILFGQEMHEVGFTADGRIKYADEKKYWSERIAAGGGKEAYEDFAESVEALAPRRQHVAAHVFGESLYENVPLVEAVRVCDNRFTMGCFHSLFGTAAVHMGTAAFIEELQTACTNRGARGMERLCLHGVGHGILGSLGYDLDSLKRALVLCEKIPDAGNITTGCWGGVFMEYNVQTLISLDAPERHLEEENEYTPCNDLPGAYQPSCMFWQPTWWHVTLSRTQDNLDVFRKMGEMCGAHTDSMLAEACVKGVGFRATWTEGYDATRIAQLCSQMKTFDHRGICWRSAAQDLRPSDAHKARSSVCDGLSEKDRAECMHEIDA